ncbi:MAG: hypothetical protein Q9160_006676 [Pyrenula sp. 1 TL-2023]
MGWLTSRSRAPSDDRPSGYAVGNPTLQFTDAQPRHDLHALGQISASNRPGTRDSPRAFNDAGDRPTTSGNASRQNARPPAQTAKSFNLYPNESPRHKPARLNVTATADEGGGIGMALGSPTHPPPRQHPQASNPSPLINSDALSHDEHLYEEQSGRNKPGKWKKIGGLFKAKNAFAQPGQSTPFYSLSNQYAASVSPNPDPKQQPTDTWPLPQPMPPGMTAKAQKVTGHGFGPKPINLAQRYDLDGSKPSIESNRSAPRPGNGPQARRGSSGNDGVAALKSFESSTMFSKASALPSLDVDIPDAQMERYSIMFGTLLGGSSSNLLARRSRMLEKLRTIDDETNHVPDLPNGSKDNSLLAPHTQTRRATSPSKSPSFNLFPNTDTERDGRRSPIPRSFTAPARLSPMQETFEHEEISSSNHKHHRIQPDADFISSPSQTNSSSTTHNQKYSTDSSFISPASTRVSTELEDDIIFNVKPLHPLSEFEEQQWELMSSENLIKPSIPPPTLQQPKPRTKLFNIKTLDPESESSPSRPPHSADVKPLRLNTQRDSHEETLAALERPLPSGQDIAPLSATKAAIDRIMSPTSAAESKRKLSDPAATDSATATSMAVEDAIRKLNEPLVRKLSKKEDSGAGARARLAARGGAAAAGGDGGEAGTYVPKLKVRNRANTASSSIQPDAATSAVSANAPPSESPPKARTGVRGPEAGYIGRLVDSRPPLTVSDDILTAYANDLDELEHQIESRAVRAMKKQYGGTKQPSTSASASNKSPHPTSSSSSPSRARNPNSATTTLDDFDFPKPSTVKPQARFPPSRSATDDPNASGRGRQGGESRAVRAARKQQQSQAAELAKARSMENLRVPRGAAQPAVPSPISERRDGNATSFISASSSPAQSPSPSPTLSPSPGGENQVQLARSVSLSKKSKQLLVPVAVSGHQVGGARRGVWKAGEGERFAAGAGEGGDEDGDEGAEVEIVRVRTPRIVEPEIHDGGEVGRGGNVRGVGGVGASSGGRGGGVGKGNGVAMGVGKGEYGRMRGHRVERSVGVVIESA